MNCESCGGVTKVVDSRKEGEAVIRRRECSDCGERFTTSEARVQVRLKQHSRIPPKFTHNRDQLQLNNEARRKLEERRDLAEAEELFLR